MIGTLLAALAALLTLAILPYLAFLGLVARGDVRGPTPPEPGRWRRGPAEAGDRGTAHDEEVGIAATVASALAADYDRDRLDVHVIADNCGDATADGHGPPASSSSSDPTR